MTGNSSERPEVGSPLWVARALNRACDRAAGAFLYGTGNKLFLCISAFLVGVILLLPTLEFLLVSRAAFAATFGMFANFLLALPAVSLLLFLTGGFAGVSMWKLNSAPVSAAVTFALALGLNRLWYGVFDLASIGLMFGLVILVIWLVLGVARHWRWGWRIGLFGLLLAVAYFYPSTPLGNDNTVFRGTDFAFDILLFVTPFVVAQGLLGERGVGVRAAISFALSPLQYVYQTLPIPPEQLVRAGERARAAGLLNLLGGFALVLFCSVCSRFLPRADAMVTAPAFLFRGWVNYLLYYVGYLGSLHIGVGIGRWLGFDLEAPADQALLAANLVDRWKRWNSYFYWFYLTFVWLPVVRRTNSLFLATLLVFLVNFLWHNVIPVNRQMFGVPRFGPELLRQLAFFCGQAVTLTAAFYYQAKLPGDSRRRGWGGVLLCHLQMAVLYGII